jgi:glycosyltransferase involved in cell wall biosynthesis
VHVLPSVPLDRLLTWTREADLGVTLLEDTCENHRLALPNKLFEYIVAGVPVIASRLPEVTRVVESYGIGWTADARDPQDVAAAIAAGLREAREPSVREGLERAAADLRWDVERHRLLELYEALAARARKTA